MMQTQGLSPKTVLAIVAAIVATLATQTTVEFPAYVNMLVAVVGVGIAAWRGAGATAILSVAAAIVAYLVGQTFVDFPDWADLLLIVAGVAIGAYQAPPGVVQPAAPGGLARESPF